MIKKEVVKKEKNKLKPRVVAGVFIFNDKDELLLIKQPKWKNKFLNPGGGVKLGEKLEEAAVREVREETNLKMKNLDLVNSGEIVKTDSTDKKNSHIIFFHYRAEVKDAKKLKLNDEASEYKWKKLGEWLTDRDLYPGMKKVIKEDLMDTDSYKEKYLRALADYQNLVKRSSDEKMEFVRYANEQMLHDILPVYDNLKVSLLHINDEAENNGWVTGIKYVVKQFKDFLESVGVEEIKTVGEKFDHNTMEALEGKGEKVVKELKSGYMLKGKVVVAAKVEVG